MSQCPKCASEIGNAGYCGCGWKPERKKETTARTFDGAEHRVKCCHDECFTEAFCKVRIKTGWANFCQKHYDEHFLREAQTTCRKLGLITTSQKRAWVKERLKNVFKPMREPGEDDEEAA